MNKFHMIGVLLAAGALTVGCGGRMSAEGAYEKGKEALKAGKAKAAFEYFEAAGRKDPGNGRYHWAAAAIAPNQNAAYQYTKMAWDSGLRSGLVLEKYARLSFFTQSSERMAFALDLYEQLPDSLRTEDLRARLFCGFGGNDSCLAVLRALYDEAPTSSLCNRMARVRDKMGDTRAARATLSECRRNGILDEDGYVMLATLLALEYEYAQCDELFGEAKALGYYTDPVQIEYGGLLIAQAKYAEAEAVLSRLATPAPGEKERLLHHRARVGLAHIYATTGDTAGLARLRTLAGGRGPIGKAERELYVSLIAMAAGTDSSAARLLEHKKALPSNPLIELLCARARVREGDYKEAEATYRELPRLLSRSPPVVTEHATVLGRLGKTDEALATLSDLHKRRVFTKRSLELFRDLALERSLLNKALAAQRFLDQKYGSDLGVRWGGAVLALRRGKADSALAVFSALSEEHPEEERFEAARLSVLFLLGKHDRVARECSTATVSSLRIPVLQARSLEILGRLPEAEAAYRKAMSQDTGMDVSLLHADFLTRSERHAEAATAYEQTLAAMKAGSEELDTAMYVAALNNLAWSLIQEQDFARGPVFSAVKKAYKLRPADPSILDTYAMALMKGGDFQGCVRLLKGNPVADGEPRLLFMLARSYEMVNRDNRALRTYEEAIGLMDSSYTLPVPESAEQLSRRIERLRGSN